MVTEIKTGNRWFRFAAGLMLGLTAGYFTVGATVRPANGQDDAAGAAEATATANGAYDKVQVEDLSKSKSEITTILMAGHFGQGQQAKFTDYYEKYALARWTDPNPKSLAQLRTYRKDLRGDLTRRGAGAPPEVHDFLAKLVLDYMNKLVAGHYHPAVQINAMLMIGELNRVEGNPPTPLPAALDVLLAAAGNAKLSPAVRIAAMVGVQRHAMLRTADDDARRAITSAVVKLAPAGASSPDAGRQWMLAQVVETVARLGALGENNAVFNIALNALSDTKLSLSTRGVAAASLARFNYESAAAFKPTNAAAAVGQFLIDACNDELQRAEKLENGVNTRRMKERLAAATTALNGENDNGKGLASAARDSTQKTFISKLQSEIKAVVKALDVQDATPEELQAAVEDFRGKVEAWAKTKP